MAIIKDVTGKYDDERQYTAGELCGDQRYIEPDTVMVLVRTRFTRTTDD